jgi:hypothetical protein
MRLIMIRCLAAAAMAALLFLVSCGSQEPEKPDADDPAKCSAAFQYLRWLALAEKPPKEEYVLSMDARTAYELNAENKAGRADEWLSASSDFARAHASNHKLMIDLALSCMRRQDSDPAFVAANESGRLAAAARFMRRQREKTSASGR